MQIELFSQGDTQAVANVLSLCIKDAKREVLEYIQNPNAQIFCAKQKGDIVGALCFMVSTDSADILDIAVLPDLQRKGVGSALLKACIDFCKDCGIQQLFLEVRRSNKGAQAFYEAFGFEEISQRKKYYSAPTEDALIYRRII